MTYGENYQPDPMGKNSFQNRLTETQKQAIRAAFDGVNRGILAIEMSRVYKRNINRNIIDQIASGHQRVSAQRAKVIEKLSGISKSVLRPDIFGESDTAA